MTERQLACVRRHLHALVVAADGLKKIRRTDTRLLTALVHIAVGRVQMQLEAPDPRMPSVVVDLKSALNQVSIASREGAYVWWHGAADDADPAADWRKQPPPAPKNVIGFNQAAIKVKAKRALDGRTKW